MSDETQAETTPATEFEAAVAAYEAAADDLSATDAGKAKIAAVVDAGRFAIDKAREYFESAPAPTDGQPAADQDPAAGADKLAAADDDGVADPEQLAADLTALSPAQRSALGNALARVNSDEAARTLDAAGVEIPRTGTVEEDGTVRDAAGVTFAL